jgi:hypothetical protein
MPTEVVASEVAPAPGQLTANAGVPPRRRGRPRGAKTRLLREGSGELGRHHFAFLRALLDGVDLERAWKLYLVLHRRAQRSSPLRRPAAPGCRRHRARGSDAGLQGRAGCGAAGLARPPRLRRSDGPAGGRKSRTHRPREGARPASQPPTLPFARGVALPVLRCDRNRRGLLHGSGVARAVRRGVRSEARKGPDPGQEKPDTSPPRPPLPCPPRPTPGSSRGRPSPRHPRLSAASERPSSRPLRRWSACCRVRPALRRGRLLAGLRDPARPGQGRRQVARRPGQLHQHLRVPVAPACAPDGRRAGPAAARLADPHRRAGGRPFKESARRPETDLALLRRRELAGRGVAGAEPFALVPSSTAPCPMPCRAVRAPSDRMRPTSGARRPMFRRSASG